MANFFIFNGQSSLELGIRIKDKNIFSVPKYDMSLVSVPGRNGDLVNSNKRFNNAIVSYTCFVPAKSITELSTKLRNIKKWLYEDVDSYHELTDSYEPDFMRYAIFNSKLDISDTANKIGTFTIQFSCHPFKYLISSMEEIDLERGMTVYNPYPFPAKPLIRLMGDQVNRFQFSISNSKGTKQWTVEPFIGAIKIDSELMTCFYETVLMNETVSGDGFPVLEPGLNTITFDYPGRPQTQIIFFITCRWNTL